MESSNYEFAAVLLFAHCVVLLGFFVLSSSSAFAAISRLGGRELPPFLAWSLSLVIGPVLMCWTLIHALYFAPGMDPRVYLGLLLAVFGLPGLALIWPFVKVPFVGLIGLYRDLAPTPLRLTLCVGLAIGVATTLGHLIVHQLFIPLWSNDPLEYAHVSRVMADLASVRDYPFTEPSLTGGLQAAWTHPLGYPGFLILGYFVQGSTEMAGCIRMVTPWLLFANACVLGAVAGYRRPAAGVAAALLLVTTPYVFHLAAQSHIDILRLAALSACFTSIWLLARVPGIGMAVVAGLATAAVHFTHSIGLITLPLMIPLYLLISRASWQVTWRNIVIVATISIAAVALRIGINIAEFGSILKDGPTVWSYEHLRVNEHREVVRLLYTTYDKVFRGVFAGWTQQVLFGWSYWVGTIGLLWAIWRYRSSLRTPMALVNERFWRDSDPIFAAVILCGGYFAFVGLTIAAGSDLVIKNPRYLLTIHPFVILVTARLLTMPLESSGGLTIAPRATTAGPQDSERADAAGSVS
ncbi:hypothetical protein [Maricaulis sp.]|uniref:hypothetical protein n=1 Tax=Maricaulis sp. TaxID=1486257 RepID=UPI002B2696DD|nr:hypothetical protein [Maricaulis sp.]